MGGLLGGGAKEYVAFFFFIKIMFILKTIKSDLKSHIINRIVHSRSFHMNFLKLAKVSFHKFHVK